MTRRTFLTMLAATMSGCMAGFGRKPSKITPTPPPPAPKPPKLPRRIGRGSPRTGLVKYMLDGDWHTIRVSWPKGRQVRVFLDDNPISMREVSRLPVQRIDDNTVRIDAKIFDCDVEIDRLIAWNEAGCELDEVTIRMRLCKLSFDEPGAIRLARHEKLEVLGGVTRDGVLFAQNLRLGA